MSEQLALLPGYLTADGGAQRGGAPRGGRTLTELGGGLLVGSFLHGHLGLQDAGLALREQGDCQSQYGQQT